MKVLFCTDGSDASYHAVQKVIPFLKVDSVLDIFYVVDWGYFPTYVTFPTEEEFFVDTKDLAQIIIGKTEEILAAQGFYAANKEYVTGNPSAQIIEKIKSNGYDLVVMGSHGKKGIENWLGSVSSKVVSSSPVPVLVARPSKNENILTVKEKQEVLFAADGSSFSYNAMQKAIELFGLENCYIDIVTVFPGVEALPLEITMDQSWLDTCLKKQKEIADEIINNSIDIFTKKNLKVRQSKLLEGNIAENILHFSNKNQYDMVVMGSHGREGVSELLLGSISKRVLNHSFVPVLVVPKVVDTQ